MPVLRIILCLSLFFCVPILHAEQGYENITPPKLDGVTWTTNLSEPVFGDPAAKKGGVYRDYLQDFPLNFRLFGPNSNSGSFVSYKRRYAFMSLLDRHPVTLKHVPELATHWAVMPDNRTIYYHLDPDATWSDGTAITADDYVFIPVFMKSKYIKDQYYNQYFEEQFESITKVSPQVIKITLRKPSWNILDDTNLYPIPKHDTVLDENWPDTYQWKMAAVPGPYVIDSYKKGEEVVFKRIANWWGEKKKYMQYKYNFDRIELKVIRLEETAFVSFKKGELDLFSPQPKKWARETRFKEIENGYILKQKIKRMVFNGAVGIFFNITDPVWSDVNLRKAFAHSFDFKTINRNYLFNLYERRDTFFAALAPYDKPPVTSYPFNLAAANKLLDEAGWKRVKNSPFRQKNGQKLSLTLNYGGDRYDEQLTYLKQTALKVGIDLVLGKLDAPALFKAVGEKSYTAVILAFGGSLLPQPRQFFHSSYVEKNTNNLNMFGRKDVDELIDIYEYDMDEARRVKAYNQIEQVQNELALSVQFWLNPYSLILNWRHIKGPQEYISIRGLNIDYLWFDPAEKQKTDAALKAGKKLPKVPETSNPYNL